MRACQSIYSIMIKFMFTSLKTNILYGYTDGLTDEKIAWLT